MTCVFCELVVSVEIDGHAMYSFHYLLGVVVKLCVELVIMALNYNYNISFHCRQEMHCCPLVGNMIKLITGPKRRPAPGADSGPW